MQNYIVYIAYGSMDAVNECRFSLLKYLAVYNLKPSAHIAVIIYTDKPALFEAFDAFFPAFEMKMITEEPTQRGAGNKQAAYQRKSHIINHFFQQYNGNLLYCDTNTYATAPLEKLFRQIQKGTFFLYEYKETIQEKAASALNKQYNFLLNKTFEYNGKKFACCNNIKVWNAGIVGINNDNKTLIEDVSALTDSIYQQYKKEIPEDFAFSYHLQQNGAVETAQKNITDYQSLKEFSFLLNAFFKKNEEESIPNLVKLLHHINPAEIQRDKEQYHKLPVYKKWLLTLTGKQWSVKRYLHKF